MPRKAPPLCGQWGLLSLLGKEAPSEPGFSVVSAQSGNDRKSDVAVTASSLQVPDAMALSVPFQEGLLTQKGSILVRSTDPGARLCGFKSQLYYVLTWAVDVTSP